MGLEIILEKKLPKKSFLLGNEAVVRGLIEAGVNVLATYPGTPSSEIGDILSVLAKEAGVFFEFSTNEKVALEVAAAAAATSLRAFTFMKHVGVNVASDSLMSTAYLGTEGGFVILTADDPSMHSSQNEQDNRIYSRIAFLPLIEPSNPQEIKDFLTQAFDISEELKLPILFRTTTRTSHMRGVVEFGEIKEGKKKGYFKKNPSQFVPVPGNAYKMRAQLALKLEKAREMANNSKLNKIFFKDSTSKIGIIVSGPAFNYLMDVMNENNLKMKVLKLGFTYPFPQELVKNFIKDLDELIVFEELEPILEQDLRALLQLEGINKKVYGKLNGFLPPFYEYNPDVAKNAFFKILNINFIKPQAVKAEISLPSRPAVLCPGCPHRATYYAVNEALKNKGITDAIFPSDIGCYTLGIQPPYKTADYLLSMGASIGASCGFDKATDQEVLSFIGDSTFFHAGLPPLINGVHNKHRFILTILDNRTTAMTGHQPNPGMAQDAYGEPAPQIELEPLLKSMGISYVKTIDPYRIKDAIKAYEEVLDSKENIRVIISKRICSLLMDKVKRKKGIWTVFKINQDKCTQCKVCLEDLACPAIYEENGKIYINEVLCDGCSVCAQVCPENTIEVKKNE